VAESPADGYFFPFSSCGFENPQAQKNVVAGLRTRKHKKTTKKKQLWQWLFQPCQ
jgi:hypothetical protein